MEGDLLKIIIEAALVAIAFFVGRYVLPKYKINIQNAAMQFEVLLNYAESFCAYARQFLDCSGKEKMDDVVNKLRAICEEKGIDVPDDETLRAIAQKAYDAMIAGENSSKVIIESAIENIKTTTYESNSANVEEQSELIDIANSDDKEQAYDPFDDDMK